MNRRATSACQNLLAGLPRRLEFPSHVYLRQQLFSTTSPSCSSQPIEPVRLPPEQYADLKDLMKALVDRTARESNGWKHTPSLRGTEQRLTASLVNATMEGRAPSVEKMAYSAGEPVGMDGEEETHDGSISPGTFIETRR